MTTRLAFGVVASSPDGKASGAFEELAAWMLAHEGLTIEQKPWPTYRALTGSVREGTSDLAWLPPVVYAWLAEAVTPLGCFARGGVTSYSGALVVLAASNLQTVAELRGVRAGWVDPWSAAGYVVPRLELAKSGVDPAAAFAKETFYGTHRDALLALGKGECDVVGTYARTPEGKAEPEGAWSDIDDLRVRVIATFGAIPSDVIAARRNLAPAEYERALGALRSACADEAARPLVRAVFGSDELREGIDAGHEALRRAFESATANGLFD